MNAELKQKWIDALRSGKYEQGTKILRTPCDEFCCLGVLLDITKPNGWGGISTLFTKDGYTHEKARASADLLTDEFRRSCGLLGGQMSVLAQMNDRGEDFNFIADWIETNIRTDESPIASAPRDSL